MDKLPNANYRQLMMNDSAQLYTQLFGIDESEFNSWVKKSFQKLAKVCSYSEVVPSDEMFDRLTNLGYNHMSTSQCHYCAKATALLDSNYECWTGFIITDNPDPYAPIITHSFNVQQNRVVDFSRLESRGVIIEANPRFPQYYYGIQLPIEFIRKFESEPSNRPRLYEWYCELKNR